MNLVKDQGLPDFIMLEDHEVNENGFLANLKLRFEKKQIYTYIGEQLVAMNPFQKMDGLYTRTTLDTYRNKYLFEVQPHIYALAEDTFRALIKSKIDQCVIVTGESGAGKTEASKIFMQYISAVSAGGKGAEHIKEKLLESNPVLEAFGNAKTLRNDNSSRFGKYMEIQFDDVGRPLGGKISQYLLEKSRVVVRARDERSFHIFYQLLSDKTLTKRLGLGKFEDYNYLKISNCYQVDNMDDAAEFKVVLKAMQTLGFRSQELDATWQILGAILNLGNVDFTELRMSNNVDASQISTPEPLAKVGELLSVEVEALKTVLTSRLVTTGVSRRASQYVVPLSVSLARFTRDSLGKALYDKIFSWVTDTVNVSILSTEKASVMIGVLDIYGFEIFENNSFEQFCINYCNEKLQQLFIKLVLKMEQEEYVREGIEWKEIDYFDNTPIVDLIEGPAGIYKLLDEAGMVGDKTPKSFLDKMDQNLANHKFYESYKKDQKAKNNKQLGDKAFRILHYAGEVEYQVEHFINKNNDTLFNDLIMCLQSSKNPMVASFYPHEPDEHEKARTRSKQQRPVSAGTQFTKNVSALIEKLQSCQPHYIRTIKSNDQKRGFHLDEERVRHQCRYLNLVETVRVRKAGFCHRQEYKGWFRRYHMICNSTWPSFPGDAKEGVKRLLDDLGISPDEYRLGKTKLFVRAAKTLFRFEDLRVQHMPKVAICIQRWYKGYRQRVRTKRIKAARTIQCFFRKWKARRTFKRLRACVRIQKAWRRRRAIRRANRIKAQITIRRYTLGFLARKKYKQKHAALTIQRVWRGHRVRVAYQRELAAERIRGYMLGWMVRKDLDRFKRKEKRRRAALKIQTRWRGVFYRRWVKAHKDRLAAEREARIRLRKSKLALYLQSLVRSRAARVSTQPLKLARTAQRLVRGFLARRRVRRVRAAVRAQAAWRSFRARIFVRRLRAVISLQGYVRRFFLRRYVRRLTQGFGKGTKLDKSNNFGKNIKFPPFAPAPLAGAEAVLKRMWHLHWGHIKIHSLSTDANVAMRQKVRAYNIFHGNKPWNPSRPFTADYCGTPSNPARQVYLDAMQHLFQANGDTQINFSDDFIKVNRKHAAQHQVIIVTDARVYKYKPKAFKMIKQGTPIRSCTGISISKGTPDTFVVVHFAAPYRDMVLDAGASGEERLSEFVTVLCDRVLALTNREVRPAFVSSINYNNSRTDKAEGVGMTLSFAKNPAQPKVPGHCEFKANANQATVYYP